MMNDAVESAVSGIPGFLHPGQATALHDLVKRTPKQSRVLEIGSYCGKSATAMVMANHASTITCLDLFDFVDGQLPTFLNSVASVESNTRVIPIVGNSIDVVSNIGQGYDMCFIDGNHHYDYVKPDYLNAYKALAPGGIMAMHDVEHEYPAGTADPKKLGCARVWTEIASKQLIDTGHCDNLYWGTKPKKTIASLILTCEKNADRECAVKDTWTKDVDSFMFIGSKDGVNRKAFGDSDDYNSCKNRIKDALCWSLENMDYDWMFLCDDDTYANIPNMRHYIEGAPEDIAVHGCLIKMCKEEPSVEYPSGGAGYLMSRGAVKELVKIIDISDPLIWFDVLVGKCGIKTVNVPGMNWDAAKSLGDVPSAITHHYVSSQAMREYYSISKGPCLWTKNTQ